MIQNTLSFSLSQCAFFLRFIFFVKQLLKQIPYSDEPTLVAAHGFNASKPKHSITSKTRNPKQPFELGIYSLLKIASKQSTTRLEDALAFSITVFLMVYIPFFQFLKPFLQGAYFTILFFYFLILIFYFLVLKDQVYF